MMGRKPSIAVIMIKLDVRDILRNEGGYQPEGLVVAAIIAIILGALIIFKWATN